MTNPIDPVFPHTTTSDRRKGVSEVFTDPLRGGITLRAWIGAQVLAQLVGQKKPVELANLVKQAELYAEAADALALALCRRQDVPPAAAELPQLDVAEATPALPAGIVEMPSRSRTTKGGDQ